jgi:endo-1,4-beta-xylanase
MARFGGIGMALVVALTVLPAPAGAAVDESRLRGARAVADAQADGDRAVELAAGQSAVVRVRRGRLSLRARAAGCDRARLRTSGAGRARTSRLTSAYGAVVVPVLAGRARFTAAGCRVRIDALAHTPDAPAHVRSGIGRAVPLGAAVSLAHLREDPRVAPVLTQHFQSLTPENELKMERTQPRQGQFRFGEADELMAFADANRLEVRGHALVYGSQTPPWVANLLLDQQVEQVLRAHVRTTVTRYRGRILEWDVVNEAFDVHGRYRSNAFYDRLGPRYIDIAFEEARAADPDAKLYYNEVDIERPGPRQAAVLAMAARLAQRGVLDGIGLQTHTALRAAPSQAEFTETFNRFGALGLDVQLTEMDVAARGDGSPTWLHLRLREQADIYRAAAAACRSVANCPKLTVWGVSDRYSWIGADQIPLLFDADFKPKLAFEATREALGQA